MSIRHTTQIEPRIGIDDVDSPLLLAKVNGEMIVCYAYRFWHSDPLSWRRYGHDGLSIDPLHVEWWAYADQVQRLIEDCE